MRHLTTLVLALGFAAVVCAQTSPRPPIYDEKADAKADIAKAVAAGQRDHKRIVLIFGGNW